MAKYSVQPINPAFINYALKFISEIEDPKFTFVGTEGPGNSTYVFECDEEDPYVAVPAIKKALRQPPIGNAMYCRVVPYGAIQWPPYTHKDE